MAREATEVIKESEEKAAKIKSDAEAMAREMAKNAKAEAQKIFEDEKNRAQAEAEKILVLAYAHSDKYIKEYEENHKSELKAIEDAAEAKKDEATDSLIELLF